MLRFDGINPYHLPMEHLRLAANLLLLCWVAYQVGTVVWYFIKSFREARATRKKLEAIAAEIRSEHIARMNKARRIEKADMMKKWGFRDPVIIQRGRRK